MWTISGWKAQLANLVRILTVGQPVVSGPHWQRLKIGGGHRHARHPSLLFVIAFCYLRPDTWPRRLAEANEVAHFCHLRADALRATTAPTLCLV
jgi:hypothetical protein